MGRRNLSCICGLFLLVASRAEAIQPMTAAELAAERGGYLTAGGFSFDFGAVVSTYIDGKLALQSSLNLADAATLARQTGLGAGSSPAISTLALPGDGGATQLLQILGPNQLSNVVLNSASNRTITQNTSVTLTVPGLSALQGQFALQQLGAQLNQAANTGRLGH